MAFGTFHLRATDQAKNLFTPLIINLSQQFSEHNHMLLCTKRFQEPLDIGQLECELGQSSAGCVLTCLQCSSVLLLGIQQLQNHFSHFYILEPTFAKPDILNIEYRRN